MSDLGQAGIKDRKVLLLIFGLFVAIVGLGVLGFWNVTESGVLSAIVVILLGIISHIFLLSSSRTLLDPEAMTAIITIPFFVLVPTYQLIMGIFSRHHRVDPHLPFIITAIMTCIYILFFACGIRIAKRTVNKKILSTATRLETQDNRRLLRQIVKFFLFAGALGWVAYFSLMGGFFEVIQNVQNKTKLGAGLGYVYFLSNLFQVGTVIAFAHSVSRRPVINKYLLAICVTMSAALFLVLALRMRSLMFIVILMIIWSICRRKIPKMRWIALIAVSFFIVLSVGRIRTLGSGGGEIFDLEELKEAVQFNIDDLNEQAVLDFGAFERISLIYEYVPEVLSFQYGLTIVSILLFPIPRGIYADKPVGSGPILANAFQLGSWDLEKGWTTGVTATIVGELYLNFWWPGVVFGAMLMGYLFGRIYVRRILGEKSVWDTTIYSVVAMYYFTASINGEWYGTVIGFLVFILPLLATQKLMSRRLR